MLAVALPSMEIVTQKETEVLVQIPSTKYDNLIRKKLRSIISFQQVISLVFTDEMTH